MARNLVVSADCSVAWRDGTLWIQCAGQDIDSDAGVVMLLDAFSQPASVEEVVARLGDEAIFEMADALVGAGVLLASPAPLPPKLLEAFLSLFARVDPPAGEAFADLRRACRDAKSTFEALERLAKLCADLTGSPGWKKQVEQAERSVNERWLSAGHDVRLIDDLARFIAELPSEIHAQIRQETQDGFFDYRKDRHASEQASEPAIVSLFDLISDVLEHLCEQLTGSYDSEIKRRLLQMNARRVVDFGAGAGYYTSFLLEMGSEVTALEVNPVKVAFLRHRAKSLGAEARLSFDADGLYDLAIAMNVFDHLDDASPVVEELAGMLKQDGRLFYWAWFPNDGFHTSDAEVIERVVRALEKWTVVERTSKMNSFGYEIRKKVVLRQDGGEVPTRGDSRLRRSPSALIEQTSRDGQRLIVHGSTFYQRPMGLEAIEARVLRALDGERTLDEIASELGLKVSNVCVAADRLVRGRVAYRLSD